MSKVIYPDPATFIMRGGDSANGVGGGFFTSAPAQTRNGIQGHLPTDYKQTSTWGWRSDPFGGGKEFHQGVDFSMQDGTNLAATIGGKVVYSGMGQSGSGYGGYGNVVAIQASNGDIHLFGHMQDVAVKRGDNVQFGQYIGHSGHSGQATGPHLHYEIRNGGRLKDTKDPMPYLNSIKNQGGQIKQSQSSSGSGQVQQGGSKPWITQQAGRFMPMFQNAGKKYGVDPALLAALSMQESSMGTSTGTNIMEANGGIAGGGHFRSYEDSIEAGTNELAARLRDAKGDVRKALAAYNMGAGILGWFDKYSNGQYSKDVMKQYSNYYAQRYGWRRYGDVDYVDHVLRYYK